MKKIAFLLATIATVPAMANEYRDEFSDFDYFQFPSVYADITEQELREFLKRVVTGERCAMSVIEPTTEEDDYESQ